MPLGIVDDNQFESELDNVQRAVVIEREKLGRKGPEVPEALRKIISDENLENGRASALALADEFNVSGSSVSAYSNGTTSTASYNQKSEGLSSFLRNRKNKLAKRASSKMLKALDAITEDKLESAKAGELSVVARNMAAIVKEMEDDNDGKRAENTGPTFVFYAPRPVKEDKFAVIEVNT